MEATIYKSTNKKMKKIALATLLEEMRTAQKQIPVTAFREMLDYCMPESHPADVEKLPVTVFSGVYNRSSGSSVLKRYNGIILVEINRLANRSEAEKIRGKATEILQTFWRPFCRIER